MFGVHYIEVAVQAVTTRLRQSRNKATWGSCLDLSVWRDFQAEEVSLQLGNVPHFYLR